MKTARSNQTFTQRGLLRLFILGTTLSLALLLTACGAGSQPGHPLVAEWDPDHVHVEPG